MRAYSFLDIIFLVNGVEISGWSEGDSVITFERFNDSASHKIGVDGEMTVTLSADRSGQATFMLMQTSDSNAYLSSLVIAQEAGVFTPVFVQMKDTRGDDICSGTKGYIPVPASMVRGHNPNEQEWRVVMERLDLLHVGGATQ